MTKHPFLKFITLLLSILIVCVDFAKATHVRAGEIIAVRVSNSSLTYRFTLTGYRDTESSVAFGQGTLEFGDGTIINGFLDAEGAVVTSEILEDQIEKVTISIQHTYGAAGKYVVRYKEDNRNAGIKNMSNSVDTPFYVETDLLIDSFVGLNDTPEFLVPPIDRGAVGVRFIHNPGAFDRNGDSLSYRITTPKQFFNQEVNDYKSPADPEFYEDYLHGNEDQDDVPTFSIDAVTGDVIWDSPGAAGEYNIAFIVEEWRKILDVWFLLGSVTRDMQIIIEDTDNNRPEVIAPPELCVLAGDLIEETIVGTDPDVGDKVRLEAFGGPFEIDGAAATYSPNNPAPFQDVPANLFFKWQTNCDLVRRRPYEVQLKATDLPDRGPKLVDFKTWLITIVAPAPTGLTTASLPKREIQLDWDAYDCGTADKLQIWRRVDSYAFDAADCVVGMPENAGYVLIDTLDNTYLDGDDKMFTTSYIDDNGGEKLPPGANYCYRIVAMFPEPLGGESYASGEACTEIGIVAPVLLKVSVDKTNKETGEVSIAWQEPTDLDVGKSPRPFTYDVIRYEGAGGRTNPDTLSRNQSATSYIDIGLNTFLNSYHYEIQAYDALGGSADRSGTASTVRLELTSTETSIKLNWEALVPWSNLVQGAYQHDVYRSEDDGFSTSNFELIATHDAALLGQYYEDLGTVDEPLVLDVEYSYRVMTRGSYGNVDILIDPLENFSQINSAELNDGIAPNCSPLVSFDENFNCKDFLASQDCDFEGYFRLIKWEYDYTDCDNDVKSFRVYFSEDGSEEGYGEQGVDYIASVIGSEYNHADVSSFKGCYRISAVDKADNEGEWSEPLCADNCPNYVLPNAFSPNGDGINDLFMPCSDPSSCGEIANVTDKCERFVKKVVFTVFDRTGGVLFDYNSARSGGENVNSPDINWDGKTNSGRELPAGVYYYGADVTFDVLDDKVSKQTMKGWIQILK